jgi:hypothetical protein
MLIGQVCAQFSPVRRRIKLGPDDSVQDVLSGREAMPIAISKPLALLVAKFETFDANSEKKCLVFEIHWHLISTLRKPGGF